MCTATEKNEVILVWKDGCRMRESTCLPVDREDEQGNGQMPAYYANIWKVVWSLTTQV